MAANNKKSPARFTARDEQIFELSRLHHSQRRVAEMVGVSQSTVRNVIKKYTEGRLHPKVDEYRQEQVDRLQIYLRSLSKAILTGDPKTIAQAIRVEERIARLLGLDAATQYVVEAKVEDRETAALSILRQIRERRGDVPE
ncbi:transposase family protein [Streptomyces sp. NBC_00459]|uniref:transposase family protein n=1 Tax=Streptomyces sp. NBC_00459 TaxID=2975749 RepID=UPI002E183021